MWNNSHWFSWKSSSRTTLMINDITLMAQNAFWCTVVFFLKFSNSVSFSLLVWVVGFGCSLSTYKEDKEKYVACEQWIGMRVTPPNMQSWNAKECHIINGGDHCILDGVTHIPSNEHFYEKKEKVVHDMFMIGFVVFLLHTKNHEKHGPQNPWDSRCTASIHQKVPSLTASWALKIGPKSPKRKESSGNHHFSRAMLVVGECIKKK